jgi:hypothetical protein
MIFVLVNAHTTGVIPHELEATTAGDGRSSRLTPISTIGVGVGVTAQDLPCTTDQIKRYAVSEILEVSERQVLLQSPGQGQVSQVSEGLPVEDMIQVNPTRGQQGPWGI